MSESKPEDYLSEEKKVLKQRVSAYDRQVELVKFVCACPDCSYCHNVEQFSHPNRKWCCKEAMLEARHKKRMKTALQEGRVPGKVGRPRKHPQQNVLYVLRAPNTDFYKVGWSTNRDTYQKDVEKNDRALPGGIDEVWTFDRPVSQKYVDMLYEKFADRVANGDWLEFSDDDLDELKQTIQLE